MAELYKLSATIHDDMTDTEIVEILRDIAKALTRLAGATLGRGKATLLSPAMQPLMASAANAEQAANTWGGPSNLAVPQIVPQRPH